jgi:hypothetical protein
LLTLVVVGICLCLCGSTVIIYHSKSSLTSISILEESLLNFRSLKNNQTKHDDNNADLASSSLAVADIEPSKNKVKSQPDATPQNNNNNNNNNMQVVSQQDTKHVSGNASSSNNNNDGNNLRLCFITCEFAESVDHADVLPVVDMSMRQNPPRHFVYTNLPDDLHADGWQVLSLPPLLAHQKKRYTRRITQSRWGKFLAFMDPRISERCDIVFYGDAYLLNPIDEPYWQDLGRTIRQSEGGLMQNRQPYTHDIPQELRRILQGGKDGREHVEQTRKWLKTNKFYRDTRNKRKAILVYKNALFGYDPNNAKFRTMVTEFWDIYSQEQGSWRDQPYWAYFLAVHGITPIHFPKGLPDIDDREKYRAEELPFGELGSKGHGGHVYVVDTNNKTAGGK